MYLSFDYLQLITNFVISDTECVRKHFTYIISKLFKTILVVPFQSFKKSFKTNKIVFFYHEICSLIDLIVFTVAVLFFKIFLI